MEALKHNEECIEAAPPACKSAPCWDGCGSALGRKGQLQPEQGDATECHSPAPATDSSDRRSSEEMRSQIMKLESVMKQMTERKIDLKATHHFAPGIYMRELFIPKGVTLTGKIHKTEHLNILSQGKLSVWTEDGMKTLTASTVIKSQPGMKRVGYAHEDTVWITVHQNPENEQSVEKLEGMLVTDTYEELLEFMKQQKQIEGGK